MASLNKIFSRPFLQHNFLSPVDSDPARPLPSITTSRALRLHRHPPPPQRLYKMSGHMHGKEGRDKMSSMDTMDLNRQATTVTMQLSPDQYERLFFQPEKPKGDLAQRLGMYH